MLKQLQVDLYLKGSGSGEISGSWRQRSEEIPIPSPVHIENLREDAWTRAPVTASFRCSFDSVVGSSHNASAISFQLESPTTQGSTVTEPVNAWITAFRPEVNGWWFPQTTRSEKVGWFRAGMAPAWKRPYKPPIISTKVRRSSPQESSRTTHYICFIERVTAWGNRWYRQNDFQRLAFWEQEINDVATRTKEGLVECANGGTNIGRWPCRCCHGSI